ncbi:hypothetical protein F66182_3706 [Fusarium sp. NRRL 66182]|nr:hypothetical protein F66182_3706 [Fusarium sp. NRRL 66182]
MAKKLNPTQFTKAVVRSFMKESGLEPRIKNVNLTDIVPSFVSSTPQKVESTLSSTSKKTTPFVSHSHPRHEQEQSYSKALQNRLQTLHGGTLASLVDLGGSLAVASTGRFATGVSTDLNGRPGDVLKGTATCDKIGKTLAFTQVTFTNSKGQLAARGSHTKYVAGTMGEDGPFVAPAEFSDVD